MKNFLINLFGRISEQNEIIQNVIESITFLIIIFTIRLIITKNINKRQDLTLDDKRKWIVNSRNLTLIILLIIMLLIWGAKIKGYALSVAAIAVAITMSFKEVIMNFMGGVSRTITNPFNIGDRISINNYRGDVVDTSMMTTKILEVGPGHASNQYTGNSVYIPNSLFLSTPVVNESFVKDYSFHIFDLILDNKVDVIAHERLLMESASIVCAPFLNKARTYMENTFRKNSVEPPSIEPRVLIFIPNGSEVKLSIRVPAPSRRKVMVELEIMRRYIESLNAGEKLKENDEDRE